MHVTLKAPMLPSTLNREIEYRDKAIRDLYQALVGNVFVDGRMLGMPDGISFTSGTAKVIDHGLGRAIRGWIEVQLAAQSGNAPVLKPTYLSTIDLTKQFRVTPTNTGICGVWVF